MGNHIGVLLWGGDGEVERICVDFAEHYSGSDGNSNAVRENESIINEQLCCGLKVKTWDFPTQRAALEWCKEVKQKIAIYFGGSIDGTSEEYQNLILSDNGITVYIKNISK